MKKKKSRKSRAPAGPLARLPLPHKTGKRHGDAKKYDRQREKARLRREIEAP